MVVLESVDVPSTAQRKDACRKFASCPPARKRGKSIALSKKFTLTLHIHVPLIYKVLRDDEPRPNLKNR